VIAAFDRLFLLGTIAEFLSACGYLASRRFHQSSMIASGALMRKMRSIWTNCQ
jgi:hypothetical protein